MRIARSTYYGAAPSPTDVTAIAEAIAAICEEFECYGPGDDRCAGETSRRVDCDHPEPPLGKAGVR